MSWRGPAHTALCSCDIAPHQIALYTALPLLPASLLYCLIALARLRTIVTGRRDGQGGPQGGCGNGGGGPL